MMHHILQCDQPLQIFKTFKTEAKTYRISVCIKEVLDLFCEKKVMNLWLNQQQNNNPSLLRVSFSEPLSAITKAHSEGKAICEDPIPVV